MMFPSSWLGIAALLSVLIFLIVAMLIASRTGYRVIWNWRSFTFEPAPPLEPPKQ